MLNRMILHRLLVEILVNSTRYLPTTIKIGDPLVPFFYYFYWGFRLVPVPRTGTS